jgi:hypothetical protein
MKKSGRGDREKGPRKKNNQNFKHTLPFFGITKKIYIRHNSPGNYFLPPEDFLPLEKGGGKRQTSPLAKSALERDVVFVLISLSCAN